MLRTETIFGFEDFQTRPLRLVVVLPSLKVPVARNWIDVRFAIVGFDGVIAIETRCDVDTFNPVEPLIAPEIAEICVRPVATPLAIPVASIVAAAGVEELQVTEAVMSCCVLSLKVPVATNCLDPPIAMLEFAGVTSIETRTAPVTLRFALPLTVPTVAVIVELPVPTPTARPKESTVATDVAEDDQFTEVSSCVLPSSNSPVATNC